MARGEIVRLNKHNSTSTVQKVSVDRENLCPFLLRIFLRYDSHHSLLEFDIDLVPKEDEIQLYTWKDCTLTELVSLIQDIHSKVIKKDHLISFKSVYYDFIKSKYVAKDIGVVVVGRHTADDLKTLHQLAFTTGDYLSVAILPPQVLNPVVISGGIGNGVRRDSTRGGRVSLLGGNSRYGGERGNTNAGGGRDLSRREGFNRGGAGTRGNPRVSSRDRHYSPRR